MIKNQVQKSSANQQGVCVEIGKSEVNDIYESLVFRNYQNRKKLTSDFNLSILATIVSRILTEIEAKPFHSIIVLFIPPPLAFSDLPIRPSLRSKIVCLRIYSLRVSCLKVR